MNEKDRVSLVQSVARIAPAESRAAALAEVSSCLGIEAVLCFTTGPEPVGMLAAPGFPPSLPDPALWQAFLTACVERRCHTAELPFPKPGELKSVTGLAWQKSAVLALVGPTPADDILRELALLLPLLAAALGHEQYLAVQATHARLAGESAEESAGPDNARRAAQREIAARQAAETALKVMGDELTRTNLELTRARDQAVAASTVKDDFLAALSHELRTPLNPVLLIASEASENPALTPAVRGDFATIAKNAEIEGRLIDDLLDITRITRGKMSLDKRGIDLRPVLEDAIATVRARLDTKKIDFVTALEPRPHSVFGDSARLQQVFWNMLKNAVKFMPSGGHIRIGTQLDDSARQIVITFTDTGVGMTPSELERISGSFSQGEHANPSRAPLFGGLGLGMTISHLLVHLHAGTIEVASAGRGKGATFTVRLPLAASFSAGTLPVPIIRPEAPPKAPETGVHVRVLLVEDHEPTGLVLARLLTRRNFDVVVTASMAEALNAAEAGRFDLVISDIGLPDGDGYSLMTVLKRRHRLRGIAVSGYGMQEDIARSEAAGFIAHVTKPVSVRALEAALELVVPAIAGKSRVSGQLSTGLQPS